MTSPGTSAAQTAKSDTSARPKKPATRRVLLYCLLLGVASGVLAHFVIRW